MENEETEEGVEKLFYELASESRLGILRELQTRNFKMQELARKLDLTDTEAFRQMQRLSEAALIQKQPDGTYAITQYGKLILHLARPMEFVHKNKECFLTRDIWRLPTEFIDRIGEISQARIAKDMFDMFNGAQQAIAEAEKYVWIIGDKPIGAMNANVNKQVLSGVKFRLIFHESLLPLYKPVPEETRFVEKRMLETSIPATLVCTEKEAGVSLLSIDGRADYALLYGKDPQFLKWATDLFLHYWNQAKPCYLTK